MKFFLRLILLAIVFGAGYYTGQQPDVVKQTLRNLSGEVLESTIGLDQTAKLQRKMLEAKAGFVEGGYYLLDHDFEGASGEFERALHHLDEAVALDPESNRGNSKGCYSTNQQIYNTPIVKLFEQERTSELIAAKPPL